MTSIDDVIERVKQILLLANRSDKPGEIEAAERMAQKLITKYQIEEAQLNGRVKADDIVGVKVNAPEPYTIEKSILLNSIAKHNFCKVLRGDRYAMIYGYTSDINLCLSLYNSLVIHMVAEMQSKLDKAKSTAIGKFYSKVWAASFFSGYCVTIDERLNEVKQETINDMNTSNTSVELVVRDKQHAIEEYFQKVSKVKSSKRVTSSPSGYHAGSDSAKLADLQHKRINK